MRIKRSLLSTLVVGAGAVSACQSPPATLDIRPIGAPSGGDRLTQIGAERLHFNEGRLHLRRERYSDAATAFHKDLLARGLSSETLYGLAAAYDGLGQAQMAARYREQAERLDMATAQLRPAAMPGRDFGRTPTPSLSLRSGDVPAAAQASHPVSTGAKLARRDTNVWTLDVGEPHDATGPDTTVQNTTGHTDPAPLGGAGGVDQDTAPSAHTHIGRAIHAEPFVAPSPMATHGTQTVMGSPAPIASAVPVVVADPARGQRQGVAGAPPPSNTRTADRLDESSAHVVRDTISPDHPLLTFYRAGASGILAETSVRIVNGNGRTGMARRFSGYLDDQYVDVDQLGNAPGFAVGKTRIDYRPGHRNKALAMAALMPIEVILVEVATARTDVVVTLGHDMLDQDPHFGTSDRFSDIDFKTRLVEVLS